MYISVVPIPKLEHLEGNTNGQYYTCKEELTIYNGTHSNETEGHYLIAIQLTNLKMEAFRDKKNEDFNTNGGRLFQDNILKLIVHKFLN